MKYLRQFFDESTTMSSMRLFSFLLIITAIINALAIMGLGFLNTIRDPIVIENGPKDNVVRTIVERDVEPMIQLIWLQGILLPAALGSKVWQKKYEKTIEISTGEPPKEETKPNA